MSDVNPVRWIEGADEECARIDRALATEGEVLNASAHRSVVAYDGGDGLPPRIVVKHYQPPASRLRALRDRVFDRAPASREWRALHTLHAQGLPIARPLAFGVDAAGRGLVAMQRIDGPDFATALDRANAEERTRLVERLAASVARLHEAGFVHGDLHLGNLRVAADDDRVTLLDVQDAHRTTSPATRRSDLARLLFALERATGDSRTGALLLAALPDDPGLDRARCKFLRDHARGRKRKHLRPGGDWRVLETGPPPRKGLAVASLEASLLVEALRDAKPVRSLAPRRSGRIRIDEIELAGRRQIRKRVEAGSLRRAIAERLRGASAARAFRRGQRDRLISDRSAPALAFLEHRAWGRRPESTLLLEHVGEVDLDTWRPASPEAARDVAVAVATWLAEQHAVGLGHRDAKAGNIRMTWRADVARFWWVDLEDLTGPRPLRERKRLHALVQLNASLADDAFDADARRAALHAYHARLPFRRPLDAVARGIHQRSLARDHRYRGRPSSPVSFRRTP